MLGGDPFKCFKGKPSNAFQFIFKQQACINSYFQSVKFISPVYNGISIK